MINSIPYRVIIEYSSNVNLIVQVLNRGSVEKVDVDKLCEIYDVIKVINDTYLIKSTANFIQENNVNQFKNHIRC